MRNLKLTVAYDGTNYSGFQRQAGWPTIQEELERALSVIVKEEVRVTGAGRTDAGVHATGQVVNFFTAGTIPVDRVPYAANSLLPPDIVVTAASEVPGSFHSRASAIRKTYCYLVRTGPFPSPFWRNYAHHVKQDLDIPAMQSAATHLVGRHDFLSFRASGSSVRTSVRTIHRLECCTEGPFIRFIVEADGFLYNMVRIIVGTLLDVGKGNLTPESLPAILAARDRSAAGPTAPPQGLYLESVTYPT